MYGGRTRRYQRWMLRTLPWLCYSVTFEDHLKHLRQVLCRMRTNGIKLRPGKCLLFNREICYLGRLVSGEGVKLDPQDLEAVLALKERTPRTVRDVHSLLGFLGYYRSFIQDFSQLARPLLRPYSRNLLKQQYYQAPAQVRQRENKERRQRTGPFKNGHHLEGRTPECTWIFGGHVNSPSHSGLPNFRPPVHVAHRCIQWGAARQQALCLWIRLKNSDPCWEVLAPPLRKTPVLCTQMGNKCDKFSDYLYYARPLPSIWSSWGIQLKQKRTRSTRSIKTDWWLMRWQKKDYYNWLLQKYQKNIRATWSMLNEVIKHNKNHPTHCEHFKYNHWE